MTNSLRQDLILNGFDQERYILQKKVECRMLNAKLHCHWHLACKINLPVMILDKVWNITKAIV